MIRFRDPGTPLTEDQMLIRKQILEQIINVPEKFSMRTWDSRIHGDGFTVVVGEESCGTTRCIAGWALYFAGIDITKVYDSLSLFMNGAELIIQDAVNVMGLTGDEYFKGPHGEHPMHTGHPQSRLFYTSDAEAVERMQNLVA